MDQTSSLSRPSLVYSIVVALGMAVVVGSALGFQYIGGYIPCELCLLQRQPYYYGIPVALVGAILALTSLPPWISRAFLLAAGILMLVGGGIGVYHAGVEWHFWEGPYGLLHHRLQHDQQCRRPPGATRHHQGPVLHGGGAARSRPIDGGMERDRQYHPRRDRLHRRAQVGVEWEQFGNGPRRVWSVGAGAVPGKV